MGMDQNPNFIAEYSTWMIDFAYYHQSFTQNDVVKFKNFCSDWTRDIDANGNVRPYDSSFNPEILIEYFSNY